MERSHITVQKEAAQKNSSKMVNTLLTIPVNDSRLNTLQVATLHLPTAPIEATEYQSSTLIQHYLSDLPWLH